MKYIKNDCRVDNITHYSFELCVRTSKFENVWSQIKTNMTNFHPLEDVGRTGEI